MSAAPEPEELEPSIITIARRLLETDRMMHADPDLFRIRANIALLKRENRELKEILNERHERRPFKVRKYRIE